MPGAGVGARRLVQSQSVPRHGVRDQQRLLGQFPAPRRRRLLKQPSLLLPRSVGSGWLLALAGLLPSALYSSLVGQISRFDTRDSRRDIQAIGSERDDQKRQPFRGRLV